MISGDRTFWQISLGNTMEYATTRKGAELIQNLIYNNTQKIAKVKPIKKSRIPLVDWELINIIEEHESKQKNTSRRL